MANEIDLNDLTIKTDSLPDNWKLMLINPTTGLPAQNVTVARFVELLTEKMPMASENSKGFISALSYSSLMRYKGIWTKDNVNKLITNGVWKNWGGDATSDVMGWGALCVFNADGYIIQMSVGSDNVRIRYSGNNGETWADPIVLNRNATAYSEIGNSLTDTVSENYSILPPRKLRAKLFRISRFGRAIYGIRYVGNKQPKWFNSS